MKYFTIRILWVIVLRNNSFKIYVRLILLEFFICVVLLLIMTIQKFTNYSSFDEISKTYKKYAEFDANVSLVLGDSE